MKGISVGVLKTPIMQQLFVFCCLRPSILHLRVSLKQALYCILHDYCIFNTAFVIFNTQPHERYESLFIDSFVIFNFTHLFHLLKHYHSQFQGK